MGETTRLLPRPPPHTVDRRTAQVAEENFFERLGAALTTSRLAFNPLDGRNYDIHASSLSSYGLDERLDALKERVKQLVDRDLLRTYDEMPKSGAVVHEVRGRDLPGFRRPRLVVAGVALSPTDELLRLGQSSTPITIADLSRARDEIVTRPDLFHFICAFATTSWDAQAADTLAGRNYLIALADTVEDTWRVRYAPDSRWGASARLFDLTSYDEKLDAVRRFVDRHIFEMLMDELTSEYVFEHLALGPDVIHDAFEWIDREADFVRYDSTSRPARLVRVYT